MSGACACDILSTSEYVLLLLQQEMEEYPQSESVLGGTNDWWWNASCYIYIYIKLHFGNFEVAKLRDVFNKICHQNSHAFQPVQRFAPVKKLRKTGQPRRFCCYFPTQARLTFWHHPIVSSLEPGSRFKNSKMAETSLWLRLLMKHILCRIWNPF